jgi:hypothetical protein
MRKRYIQQQRVRLMRHLYNYKAVEMTHSPARTWDRFGKLSEAVHELEPLTW